MAIVQDIEHLILAPIESLGYELVGVEYVQSGRQHILRIYIDSAAGIGIADCEKVSHQVSGVLDVEDPIQAAYLLEVSSPGFDRPLFKLADFSRFVGHMAKISLKLPIQGRRNFTGQLSGVEQEEILIEVDGEIHRLPFSKLAKARLVG